MNTCRDHQLQTIRTFEMFAAFIKLLLLISINVSLAHGRHCQTKTTCFEAKFTLHKDSKTMIGKSSSMHLGTFKNCNFLFCSFLAKGSTVIHDRRDDDEEPKNEELVHFSPCDDIGPATFAHGNAFEICVCHQTSNGLCNKRRLVKSR